MHKADRAGPEDLIARPAALTASSNSSGCTLNPVKGSARSLNQPFSATGVLLAESCRLQARSG